MLLSLEAFLTPPYISYNYKKNYWEGEGSGTPSHYGIEVMEGGNISKKMPVKLMGQRVYQSPQTLIPIPITYIVIVIELKVTVLR